MKRQPAKAAQDREAALPEGAESSVRLEDVMTYLKIYEKAERPEVEGRANISTLLTDDPDKKGLTTRISQMERIVKFLFGEQKFKEEGLRTLFEKDHIGGLVPTADARELHKYFEVLRDVYRKINKLMKKKHESSPPVLRCGASQTIGIRLLASILSHRQRLFPDGARLEVEFGDSHDLISRLNAHLLDVVIAYGSSNERKRTGESGTTPAFRSLGYDSRMVLLCSPNDPLWIRGPRRSPLIDANKEYWQTEYHGKDRRHLLPYEKLREIELPSIDFARTRLILVDSWQQPEGLNKFLEDTPASRRTGYCVCICTSRP